MQTLNELKKYLKDECYDPQKVTIGKEPVHDSIIYSNSEFVMRNSELNNR